MPVQCPILRRCPHKEDCHYCREYNYNDGICLLASQDEQAVTPQSDISPIIKIGEFRHLENKLNEHLDFAKKKKVKSKYA